MTKPIPIDAAFEREAKIATRACFVCKQEFRDAALMEQHRYREHPDYGRPRIEWNPKTRQWVGGGL